MLISRQMSLTLARLVGTDLHHERHLAALQDKGNLAAFHRHIEGKINNDLEGLSL